MKKLHAGFTVIELLVVIAIIGIIATIVLVQLNDSQQKAKDSKILEQLSSMRSQAELFLTSHGNYGTVSTVDNCMLGGGTLFMVGDSNSLSNIILGMPSGAITSCRSRNGGAGPATHWGVAVDNGRGSVYCVDDQETVITDITTADPTSVCYSFTF